MVPESIPIDKPRYDQGRALFRSGGSLLMLLADCEADGFRDPENGDVYAVSRMVGFADAALDALRGIAT